MLSCGVHQCPSKCHQLLDHSKMTCEAVLDYTCPNGHRRTYRCHQPPPSVCVKCEKAAEIAAKKKQKDFEKQQKRDAELREHAQRIAKLDEEIEAEQDAQREQELARERANAILQKQKDLADAKARTAKKTAAKQNPPPSGSSPTSPPPTSSPTSLLSRMGEYLMGTSSSPSAPSASVLAAAAGSPTPGSSTPSRSSSPTPPSDDDTAPPLPPSKSELEWQRQKDFEGADNASIDAIMEMTGLEKVKEQVLQIKAKVDTARRQGTSIKDERFNVVLQGNPGTGT